MRHRVKGKELNRNTGHRRALNRFMATSFMEQGTMTTSHAKASFVRPFIEKLVTEAKRNDLSSIRVLNAELNTQLAIDNLRTLVAPKFEGRNGGYTRITKLGYRVGDDSPMVRLEWVEKMETKKVEKEKVASKTPKAPVTAKAKVGKKVEKKVVSKVKGKKNE